MLLFISLSGILVSVILIYFSIRDYKPAINLGLFFLGLSMYALNVYILLFSKSVDLVSFFLLNYIIFGTLIYLAGPAFCSHVMRFNHRIKLFAVPKNHPNGQKINYQQPFEPEYLRFIQEKADSCMKNHQPYLDPDCNLGHLARLVNLPAHHLAWYFRETKKQHFNDYRNEWRVNHAKKLITGGDQSQKTLENIAFQSGFSNRNTFLAAFKRFEGISPQAFALQFRRNLQHP